MKAEPDNPYFAHLAMCMAAKRESRTQSTPPALELEKKKTKYILCSSY